MTTLALQQAAASRPQFAATLAEFHTAIDAHPDNAYLRQDLPSDLSNAALESRPLCLIAAGSLSGRKQYFYIQNNEGRIDAAVTILPGDDAITLEHLAVRPEAQDRKYATTLMRAVMAHCTEQRKDLEASLADAPSTERCMELYGRRAQEFPDLAIFYPGQVKPVKVAEIGPYEVLHPYPFVLNVNIRRLNAPTLSVLDVAPLPWEV